MAVLLASSCFMSQSDAPALPANITAEKYAEQPTNLASTGKPVEISADEIPDLVPPKTPPLKASSSAPETPVTEQKTEIPSTLVVSPVPAVKGNGLLPGEDAFAWMDRMQREYGVYAYPGTQFFVAPSTPCTFQAQVLGCTEQWMNMDGTPTHTRIRLHLTETAVGNVYVLFHEIGHTQGIIDECQADIYSRKVTGIPGGFYC
jgi:hypothetical protein